MESVLHLHGEGEGAPVAAGGFHATPEAEHSRPDEVRLEGSGTECEGDPGEATFEAGETGLVIGTPVPFLSLFWAGEELASREAVAAAGKVAILKESANDEVDACRVGAGRCRGWVQGSIGGPGRRQGEGLF